MRLFIAIEPSENQRKELQFWQQQAGKELDGVKWVDPAALHLTLKFLGEQEEKRLAAIFEAMQEAVLKIESFTLQFGKIGVFPSPRRARVIWAGVTTGADELTALAGSLETALGKKGFAAEKRFFKAHLTLGRVRRPPPESLLRDLLETNSIFSTAKSSVQSIRLYRSDLSPRGARYIVLKEIYFYEGK